MSYRSVATLCCVPLFVVLATHSWAQTTGSVTQGFGTTEIESLLDCPMGRMSPVGTITAMDGTVWTVPAETNYDPANFATDLFNPCNGNELRNSGQLDLDSVPIVDVDADGDVVTAYIFADNYFELYVNETLIGVDAVPFTQFNSHVLRFRVSEPYAISTLLVDWEENLGLGSKSNRGFDYHPGDAGLVATFHDEAGDVVAITDETWKAQTYYIAPVNDLDCISEVDGERLSASCSTASLRDGSDLYGIHYPQPEGWTGLHFDDSAWPDAHTYTNNTVGVNNKPSYTNFTDLFDDPQNDAQFIWSSNLVLDNLVLARKTIGAVEATCDPNSGGDLDGNGMVEFADFLALARNFGQPATSHEAGDIDCDGMVEFDDFLALAANFGSAVAATDLASVPEPDSFVLIAIVIPTLLGFRRRTHE